MKGLKKFGSWLPLLSVALVCVVMLSVVMPVNGQMKMKMPKMVTVKGTLIDLTCASKGKALMNSWHNAESNDHMTPNGPQKQCATMCLKGGQPAAIFSRGKIEAVLACNPKATLSDFAAKSVEVKGFYAGDGQLVKTFIPAQIRSGSGAWQKVDCATMHN